MSPVEPADALLTIDIGNSRVALGVWDSDGLHDARHIGLRRDGRVAWRGTWPTPGRA